MKYLVLALPGLSESEGHNLLEGKTPLAAARLTGLNRLSNMGRMGTVETCPEGLPVGSDVGLMSLLGYDPERFASGRAALEALGMGQQVEPGDWLMRLSFVHVRDGLMCDANAGGVTDAEAHRLLEEFAPQMGITDMEIRSGGRGRHVLVDHAFSVSDYNWNDLVTCPPYACLDKPIEAHLPVGGNLEGIMRHVISASEAFLRDHEINQMRVEMGEQPITHLWPWGQGQLPGVKPLRETWQMPCAMVASRGVAVGMGRCADMTVEVLDEPAVDPQIITSAKQAALEQLERHDLVVVYLDVLDAVAHSGDIDAKMEALDRLDKELIDPLLDAMPKFDGWRMMVAESHSCGVTALNHERRPGLFVMAGTRMPHVVDAPFDEEHATVSQLHVREGYELMEFFLKHGL